MPKAEYKSLIVIQNSLLIKQKKKLQRQPCPKRCFTEQDPTHACYTTTFPSSWWLPRIFTSAHTNNLLIIAKRKTKQEANIK